MDRTLLTALVAATALAGASALAATPTHFAGQTLMSHARISLAQARATALKARPGTIVDQELEREAGGSGFRYSFDVKAAGGTFEVGVDAATGRILENGSESAASEADETRTEAAGGK